MIRNKEPSHLHRTAQAIVAALLIQTSALAAQETDSGHSRNLFDLLPALAWPLAAVMVTALVFFVYLLKSRKKSVEALSREPTPDVRFSREHITHTFVSAIPTLTRELNLEVATTEQVETFERSHEKSILWGWVNLGTNTATIRVPVTFRFHIRLYDAWRLEVNGSTLLVHSPSICPSLPPAFHSDRMEVRTTRGWARLSPENLLAELHRDLTPTLNSYAGDPRRITLVQEACRQSVAEFIQKWLEGESRWKPGAFTIIQVRFPDEPQLPSAPTRKLIEG